MRHLNDTIERLRNAPRGFEPEPGDARTSNWMSLENDFSNPGNLKSWFYVPDAKGPLPLVVVLHGCTQSALGYDRGTGWSALAEKHHFAVLFPEQQRANNPNLCFNWFSPDDTRRGSGEVMSVRNMVAAMIDRYGIDSARVFVTGLSAGGAMAASLLASYPDVFAGGAIIAGLPAGAASTMAQAFDRMRGHGHLDATRSADHVRQSSDHRGPWPMVSVWHGSADATVASSNAEAILAQWQNVHGVAAKPDREQKIDGACHRQWQDGDGRIVIEDFRIPGMGHGTPIATAGKTAGGSPAPYILDVGISSAWHSADQWGLLDPELAGVEHAVQHPDVPRSDATKSTSWREPHAGIQHTIETALRSAGLM
ncbi:extracellular catalytic domain type 1 short-chain-length polyhydroxyalkanoate depolymerase [Sphingomonas oligophenolica]|uniref:PHB depolymerase family esterase n=1 Tax=Sphingomonas oligophenolica TaxID=301154 RepID=A0A502CD20_9SPHN|nr:PHB depolymerase family esterase [Sphingomonas oligophenolica]TPG09651.1 hypothetical protein EAH84_13785 [Sphingomonas oligophenolica]